MVIFCDPEKSLKRHFTIQNEVDQPNTHPLRCSSSICRVLKSYKILLFGRKRLLKAKISKYHSNMRSTLIHVVLPSLVKAEVKWPKQCIALHKEQKNIAPQVRTTGVIPTIAIKGNSFLRIFLTGCVHSTHCTLCGYVTVKSTQVD